MHFIITYPQAIQQLWAATPEPPKNPPFKKGDGFGFRKLLYYKGFPGMSTPVFTVSVCSILKIKGRDCGTINGHDESSSIRALMKDAREVLVRLSDTYILYNRQIGLTGSNPLSSMSCRSDGYATASCFSWLNTA
ncbi:hypothetical protein CVW50_23400 [Salmonella enterica]|nr:hypothetical protein [Salmonella enterica]